MDWDANFRAMQEKAMQDTYDPYRLMQSAMPITEKTLADLPAGSLIEVAGSMDKLYKSPNGSLFQVHGFDKPGVLPPGSAVTMNGYPKWTFDNWGDGGGDAASWQDWNELAGQMSQKMSAEQQQRLEEIFGAPKKPPPAVEPEPLRFDHKRRIEL
jgi:hypothetical protein